MPVLTYDNETMIWREKESSRIRVAQMDNLRGLLVIRRMDKVPNTWTRQLCGVTKGVNEKIDEGVLRRFGHVERMENDRVAKWVCVGECAGSRSVGRPRKRWIDTMKDCLKKRIMIHDRNVWRGFVRGNAWGVPRGMNP